MTALSRTAVLALPFLLPPATSSTMQWEERSTYDTTTLKLLGRHHPIVFANETHAFLLGGSTRDFSAASDFYIYDEAANQWTDHTQEALAFPPRSFGYGVVLNQANHPKAYLGFGEGIQEASRLNDLWEFDMTTLEFKQLASCPGMGRRHPSMVPVYNNNKGKWQIHVGLGDGYLNGGEFSNLNDYWSYDIETDQWTQLPDFPSTQRHHPFFFGLGDTSYTGLGHSDGYEPYIERDFYSYSTTSKAWTREADFESYSEEEGTTTTEARVAGTEFSIDLPLQGSTNASLVGSIGFVLSGDGDDHSSMSQGEFHAFYPPNSPLLLEDDKPDVRWRQLTPHPGESRWAPGSFVMRGTARAYFTSGYNRATNELPSDVWRIDLSPLFEEVATETETSATDNEAEAAEGTGAPVNTPTEDQDDTSAPINTPVEEQDVISDEATETEGDIINDSTNVFVSDPTTSGSRPSTVSVVTVIAVVAGLLSTVF